MKTYRHIAVTASMIALCAFVSGCIVYPHTDKRDGAAGGEPTITGVGGGSVWNPPPSCPPGEERPCWCTQGYESAQVCEDDGETLGACDCLVECMTDANCHGSLCEPATCEDGVCVRSLVPDGVIVLTSPQGDCAVQVCDTKTFGGVEYHVAVFAVDNTDTPDDQNPCTIDVCAPFGPSHSFAPIGTMCTTGICDGAGHCKPVFP